MALAIVIGLVLGYAWSVQLLYRQARHGLPPQDAAARAPVTPPLHGSRSRDQRPALGTSIRVQRRA